MYTVLYYIINCIRKTYLINNLYSTSTKKKPPTESYAFFFSKNYYSSGNIHIVFGFSQ